MSFFEEMGAAVRSGEARVEMGDPLCDHIWRSPNPLSESLLWFDCIHCESTIQIIFYDALRLPRGAS